ncbi:MAG: signal peptidase II [Chloroflexota bacterium]|nr:signal peptidase II [Chloroflexota bacterium]
METPANREACPSGNPHIAAGGSEEATSTQTGGESLAEAGPPSVDRTEPTGEVSESGNSGQPTEALPEESSSAVFRKRPIFLDFDLLQLAAIFFLLDQLTKFLVRAFLPFGSSYPATGFFRFTHAENTGSAFGLFQGHNTPLIVISFVGIFVLAMIYQSQPRPTNLLRLSLGLQIGGALGNLVDRFRLGAVTDFIDVGPWPIFNLADSSIICGLLLLGWIILQPGRRAANPVTETVRDYSLKRRGRCARCGRFHSGRRAGCRTSGYVAGGRRLSRRALRR